MYDTCSLWVLVRLLPLASLRREAYPGRHGTNTRPPRWVTALPGTTVRLAFWIALGKPFKHGVIQSILLRLPLPLPLPLHHTLENKGRNPWSLSARLAQGFPKSPGSFLALPSPYSFVHTQLPQDCRSAIFVEPGRLSVSKTRLRSKNKIKCDEMAFSGQFHVTSAPGQPMTKRPTIKRQATSIRGGGGDERTVCARYPVQDIGGKTKSK
jgi:hypothetical protein